MDLGLLQHDFGHPDGVGVLGAAPREIAGVFSEASQKASGNIRRIEGDGCRVLTLNHDCGA
jgi:hypothetical protein